MNPFSLHEQNEFCFILVFLHSNVMDRDRNEIYENEDSASDFSDYDVRMPDQDRLLDFNEDSDTDIEEPVGFRPGRADLQRAMWKHWLPLFDHQETGVLFDVTAMTDVQIFIKLLGGDDTIDMMVNQTNHYAQSYIDKNKDNMGPHSYAEQWKPVDVQDMKCFLALILFMGYVKFPAYEDYWNTDAFAEMPGFRSLMGRNRFLRIMNFFHLADNDAALPPDDPAHDKLYKIRPFLDTIVPAWQQAYYPSENMSVDESIVAFKGRSAIKVYKPAKPHKWGLNAWVLAESGTGYVYNWNLYTGKTAQQHNGDGVSLTQKVVVDLCNAVKDRGHTIFMDNYFSSPSLYHALSEMDLGACGTLRVNRAGVPQDIKECKLKPGDQTMFRRNGNTLFISWFDRRQVNLMTTVHNQTTFRKTVRCRDPANDNQRQVVKPMAVELYTMGMGGWTI